MLPVIAQLVCMIKRAKGASLAWNKTKLFSMTANSSST